MKDIKHLFSQKLFFIVVLTFLSIGVILVLGYLEEQHVPQAHAETYYADAIGKRQTDQCNRVRVQISESPACSRLTQNTPNSCQDIAGGRINNLTDYSVTLTLRSNDGQPHAINYGTDNNFCDSGRAVFDSAGYCACVSNSQQTNAQTLSIPASGTRTITLNRANPYGLACGSYQMDFWINSVDGNATCSYGNNVIVGASGLCETGTTCPPVTPTPATYTIDGAVFHDGNKNGWKEAAEPLYTANRTITSSGGTITYYPDGIYTISNLPAGTYTVSYTSLPANYSMTYPLNGPPPSFNVTVGPGCNTNGVNNAVCSQGNISDLKFGITNLKPWIQTTCGSLRMDNGITNPVSSGQTALITSASCTSPGVAYSGDGSADFGEGQLSATDWQVGGLSYPEVYTPASSGGLEISYESLLAKQLHAKLTTTNLASVCSLNNCTLPANLAHGIYRASGNVFLNGYTFPANQDYVFLIDGNLYLRGTIRMPQGNNTTGLFATSGDIIVDRTVGVAATSTQPSLEGIYSADGSFIINGTGGCADLRLNIGGSVVTNAALGGGTFQNNRDLCADNADYPTVSFVQRLDFLLNAPEFIQQQNTYTTEVAP